MAKRDSSSVVTQNKSSKKARVASNQPAAASAPPRSILKKPRAIGSKNATTVSQSAPPRQANGAVKGNSDIKGKGKGRAIQSSFPADLAERPSRPATAFEVVAGSYERLLYGLHCTPSGIGENTAVDVQPIFQFPAHLHSLKSVATSPNGRWLVTGSTDEVIKVWDLRRRKEVGGLVGHEGDITCLTFPSDKYLVSASADGTLCLFRTKDWSLLRRFKGHKGRINYVAVHPNGRVALTVSRDRCLRLWDLLGKTVGDTSTSTRLGAEADVVRWNSTGDQFAVVLDREIRIYRTNMSVIKTLASPSRFHDVLFVRQGDDELFLVACDDGKVRIYRDLAKEGESSPGEEGEAPTQHIAELVGHTNRVKELSVLELVGQKFCTTVSTDGTIKIYNLSSLQLTGQEVGIQSPTLVSPTASFDTKGSRLTCMHAVTVNDDRTTYAESVAAASGSDSDSDSEAGLNDDSNEDEDKDLGESDSEMDGEDEVDDAVSDGEWAGIGE